MTERSGLRVANGSLEGVKWLALVLMTGDHINKYLFDWGLPWAFELGRLVLPLFAAVLGYNLARLAAPADCLRVLRRMLVVGLVASVPFVALGKLAWGFYPLNIMFTLAVSVGVVSLLLGGARWQAWVLFLVGGALVEFWWFGVAVVLASWHFSRKPGPQAFALVLASILALSVVNQNLWALAALPILWLASRSDWRVPRVRHAFYAYYPAHLVALWAVSLVTSS